MSSGSSNFAVITIDSRDRISGIAENAIYQFPTDLSIRKMKLVEAEIPNSFYNIRNINTNYLVLDVDEGSGAVAVTIPAAGDPTTGYTLATFLAAIKTALDASLTLTYTVTHNTGTNKVTIAASGTFDILWQTGANKSSLIASMLGYSRLQNDTNTNSYEADNTLNIKVNNVIDMNATTVFMTVGRYTSAQFILALESAIDTALPALAPSDVTIDASTGKVTIDTTASGNTTAFEFATGANRFISSFNDVIGFSATDTAAATTQTSDTGTINLVVDRYIYIKSDQITGSDQGFIPANSIDDNVLGRIQTSKFDDDIVFYTNPGVVFTDITNVSDSNQINLKLTYRDDQPINLEGNPWSARILVSFA